MNDQKKEIQLLFETIIHDNLIKSQISNIESFLNDLKKKTNLIYEERPHFSGLIHNAIGVYAIVNLSTPTIYIGQSQNLNERLSSHRIAIFSSKDWDSQLPKEEICKGLEEDFKQNNIANIHKTLTALPLFYFTINHTYEKQDQRTLHHLLETVERDIMVLIAKHGFVLSNNDISIDRQIPKPDVWFSNTTVFDGLPYHLDSSVSSKQPSLKTMSDHERQAFADYLKRVQIYRAKGNDQASCRVYSKEIAPVGFHRNVGYLTSPIISIKEKTLYRSATFLAYALKTVTVSTIQRWVRAYPNSSYRIAFEEEVIQDRYLEKYDNVSVNQSLFFRSYSLKVEVPVVIDNCYYESQTIAAKQLSLYKTTVSRRVNDPKNITWRKATPEEIETKSAHE